VADLQTALNSKPSRLPRLVADGIFGPRTRERVLEFQRSNGLQPDGIVGEKTCAKLRGGDERPFDLQRLVNELALSLSKAEQVTFLRYAQPLVAQQAFVARPPVIGNAPPIPWPVVIVFLLMILMMAVALQSRNPAVQQMGREWEKKINQLRERIKDMSSEQAEAASLEQTKAMAREYADKAIAERDKCLEQLQANPQRLQKLRDCKTKFEKLTEAIKNLLQKLTTPLGGGRTPETLIKGIDFSVKALIEALRDLGTCTGCDNLFF
jgi:ABC-type transport system involved in cytochrome bd biosynthesis fused ATPase/permease subunit